MYCLVPDESERRYLASLHFHLHSRLVFTLMGILFLTAGLTLFGELLQWTVPLATACCTVGVTSGLLAIARILIPCKCGKLLMLNARGRKNFMLLHSILSQGLRGIIFATLAITIGTSCILAVGMGVELLGDELFGAVGILLFPAGLFAVLGCLMIIAAVLNKVPNHPDFITEREQQVADLLKGDSERELHKLIAFYLKAGNFPAADSCSRNLLALAEGSNESPQLRGAPSLIADAFSNSYDVSSEDTSSQLKHSRDQETHGRRICQ